MKDGTIVNIKAKLLPGQIACIAGGWHLFILLAVDWEHF